MGHAIDVMFEGSMEYAFVRLAALVTDTPEDRPAALAEARTLLAQIGKATTHPTGVAITKLVAALDHDVDVWFGPRHLDGSVAAIAAAKATLLANLLKLHAALLQWQP